MFLLFSYDNEVISLIAGAKYVDSTDLIPFDFIGTKLCNFGTDCEACNLHE